MNPYLVDTDWLFAHLDDPDVSIVDGSWYLPTMLIDGVPRSGPAEFDHHHIPGAVYFNIDDIVETGSTLPHTLASPETFGPLVGALGISHNDTIVVYDGMGLFSAPRVWWNFRVMGATKVVILDGGMPKWLEDRLPIESGTAPIYPKLFEARFDKSKVVSLDGMRILVEKGDMQVADARPAGRFSGVEPEPRPGIRPGHMPGANNVPFSSLTQNGKLLSSGELEEVFAKSGIDLKQPIATTCGSGVTAAALSLALETIGHTNHVLYDGSWAEWGGRSDTDVVTDS